MWNQSNQVRNEGRRKFLRALGMSGIAMAVGTGLGSVNPKTTYALTHMTCLNVMDYAADPTGATDCTTAFQNVINDALLSGQKIVVPEGKYMITGSLMNIKNIVFEGVTANKSYWTAYNDFESGTILFGANTNSLFSTGIERGVFSHIGFKGFLRIADPSSPRSLKFINCSFKNMQVLNAPSDVAGAAYHNFKFIDCSFTVYALTEAVFHGRLIDCLWDSCIFVGSSAFNFNGAKANMVTNCRMEWIDRLYAIDMYGSEFIQLQNNFFDRISGNAIVIRQSNDAVMIEGNVFNRCGSGLTSSGTDLAYDELAKSFIKLYGQITNILISGNTFTHNLSGDGSGVNCPKYVLSKEKDIVNCQFTFKNNEFEQGFTTDFLYVENQAFHKMKVYSDYMYPALTPAVVQLAKVSRGAIHCTNENNTSVAEIPLQLKVVNVAEIVITGKQEGSVYGGKVNGRQRYSQDEVLFEDYTSGNADGAAGAYRKVEYTVPVNDANRGTLVTFALVYSTTGNPNRGVDIHSATNGYITSLTSIVASSGKAMYKGSYYIPESYTASSIKLVIYASKSTAVAGTIEVYGCNASYGNKQMKALVDFMG
ncbi:Pectate lyase superfamily protein [compost metagenome]